MMAKGLTPKDCWQIMCKDQCTWEEESEGLLTTVFKDGKLIRQTTLDQIRDRIKNYN